MLLEGRVALVTGAAQGNGEARPIFHVVTVPLVR